MKLLFTLEKELKKSVEPKFKVGDWIISSVLGTARIIGVNDSNEFQLIQCSYSSIVPR